jgi:hypothetical protein
MGKWETKAETHLLTLLKDGEKVIRTADGLYGKKAALMALTDRRVLIICGEPWKLRSRDKMELVEIPLQYIGTVETGQAGLHIVLAISSRTGAFQLKLIGDARAEASMWPNWILEAQGNMVA